MNNTNDDFDANDFIGGTYIKKQDLDAGPQRFTIAGVSRATFAPRDSRPAEEVLQLEFEDDRKFTLSAKVNIRILIKAFGRKTPAWVGKSIILYIDENVSYGGTLIGGVRIRIPDGDGGGRTTYIEAMSA